MRGINFYFFPIYLLLSSFLFSQSLEEKELIAEGNEFFSQQKWELAQAKYAKALTLRPSSVKANYNMGNLFYEQNLFSKAQPYFERAAQNAQSAQQKARIFHNLGNTFMRLKKYKEAEKAYKNSLLQNPKDNETRYNFALAKKLLNLKEKQENKNKENKPEPSDFALKVKTEADEATQNFEFSKALEIMQKGLEKDSTLNHFQDFMTKLKEITLLDSIK